MWLMFIGFLCACNSLCIDIFVDAVIGLVYMVDQINAKTQRFNTHIYELLISL